MMNRTVKLVLVLFSTIHPTYCEFANPRFLAAVAGSPIDGSEHWVTCWHAGMYTCEHQCCCSEGFEYDGGQSCVKPTPKDEDQPGFQFLGYGYDVLVGNPLFTTGSGDKGMRTNVFAFSHTQNLKTPDGMWNIPDKTASQALSACSTDQTVNVIDSIYTYQHTVGANFEFDFPLFGAAFTFSIDAENVRTNTYKNEYVFAQVQSTCAVYDLTMQISDAVALDSNFVTGVSELPVMYDEDAYMLFIKQFGTHAIYQMTLGGRWGWQLQFQGDSYQSLLDNSVDVNVGIQMGGAVKAGINLGFEDKTDTRTAVMNAIYKNSSFNIGGNFQSDPQAWRKSVQEKPMPLKFSLLELSNLFTNLYMPNATDLKAKRENMKTATGQYCSYRKKNVDPKGSCEAPIPKPDPTPAPVDPNAIHKICVENRGGYAMWFETSSSGEKAFADDSPFPNPQSRCVDGMQLGLTRGQKLHCQVHIIAGSTTDCTGGDYAFDDRSHLQANYRCDGTTMNNQCVFTGLTNIS